MNRKHIIEEALCHRETPIIPYQVDFTVQALANLIAHTKDEQVEEKIGSFINCVQYWGWPTELPGNKPGYFTDEFGVVWNRSGPDKDIGVIEKPVIPDLEECSYEFPIPDIARLRGECEALTGNMDDRFTIAGFGFCMFERSWSLMGMENVLMYMMTCPEALEDFYDRILNYHLDLVDIVLEYDIDGVYFGDDWGQQKGLIMGPEHWRRFIKPRMAKLYQKVKEKNKYIVQHSCGDCNEILQDLIEIGLDCYQTFQPEIYDLERVKRLYGDKLAFWGGVSTQQCLPRVNADEVKAETVRVMKAMRKDGGLIIAPTHAIPYDVPPENVLAMVDVFQNQSKYL